MPPGLPSPKKRSPHLLVLLLPALLALSLEGCTPSEVGPSATATATVGVSLSETTEPPAPPLKLSRPGLPPARWAKLNLAAMQAEDLTFLMQDLYRRADYPSAAQAGQWAASKGGEGRYDLACCLALSGQTERAFYFLQEAATLEGVDPEHAQQDPDLAILRSDSRWNKVRAFLEHSGKYWAEQKILNTTLILPHGYQGKKALGVVVGLHGLGGNERFVDENCQSFADRLNMAFVGVSGSVPLGPKSFRWSEDVTRDREHLEKALLSLKDKVQIEPGRVILFGFSQGAEMAFELAASQPDAYLGALAFSPGCRESRALEELHPVHQRFIITAGAGEHPDTVQMARDAAALCEKTGVEVQLKIYAGVHSHSFPPDFSEQFVPWVEWIRKVSR